jgi:hypothetical protein
MAKKLDPAAQAAALKERADALASEPLFADSIATAADDDNQYLGDAVVVETILRAAIGEFMSLVQEGKATQADMERIARRAAGIFLGHDKDFTPVPKWNAPGHIDEFVAKWVGSEETDAVARLEQMMVEMMGQSLEIARIADRPDALDEEWKWQLPAMFQEYTWLLLGIPPGTEIEGAPENANLGAPGSPAEAAAGLRESTPRESDSVRQRRIRESWKHYP